MRRGVHPRSTNMTPHTPEEWNPFVIVHNTMPPRDPEEDEEDGDEEEEEEEDEEDEAAQDRGSPPDFGRVRTSAGPSPTGDARTFAQYSHSKVPFWADWILPVVLDSMP
jgi:hypothetical protein